MVEAAGPWSTVSPGGEMHFTHTGFGSVGLASGPYPLKTPCMLPEILSCHMAFYIVHSSHPPSGGGVTGNLFPLLGVSVSPCHI